MVAVGSRRERATAVADLLAPLNKVRRSCPGGMLFEPPRSAFANHTSGALIQAKCPSRDRKDSSAVMRSTPAASATAT